MSTTTKTKSVLYDQLAKVPWDWHFLVHQVNWLNTTKLVVVHALFVYGNYYVLDKSAKLATILLTMFLGTTSALALSLGKEKCVCGAGHRGNPSPLPRLSSPLVASILQGHLATQSVPPPRQCGRHERVRLVLRPRSSVGNMFTNEM